jgi:hypothetical protein
MHQQAPEMFKFNHRLAPLKMMTSTSFSHGQTLLKDLSQQYHTTIIDAFDFVHEVFGNKRFLYLFEHKMTLNEKKILQLICRQLEVNRETFLKMLPILLKNELIYFEQYVHHLNINYAKIKLKDPLIKEVEKEEEGDQNSTNSESDNHSQPENLQSDSQMNTQHDTQNTNQVDSKISNDSSQMKKQSFKNNNKSEISPLELDSFLKKVNEIKGSHVYSMQHDAFLLKEEEALWGGVGSFYIRLLKFRLSFNDCQNQGFILLNIEHLFEGLDLGYFFYTHPLLNVCPETLTNSFATLLYSLHEKPIKYNFFMRNTDRPNLLVWDNFDIIWYSFQFFKQEQKLTSLNKLNIDHYFEFLKKYFLPAVLIKTNSESSSSKFQEDEIGTNNLNEVGLTKENDEYLEIKNEEDGVEGVQKGSFVRNGIQSNSSRVSSSKQDLQNVNQIAMLNQDFEKVKKLFDEKTFLNFDGEIKNKNIEDFMDINLDQEQNNKINEVFFLQGLMYSNLGFAQIMKNWGEMLKKNNLVTQILQSLYPKESVDSETNREDTGSQTRRGGVHKSQNNHEGEYATNSDSMVNI